MNKFKNILRLIRHVLYFYFEKKKVDAITTTQNRKFVIVSGQYNAGEHAIKCLDSIYYQNYDRSCIQHIFIDDASTNNTHQMVLDWLKNHPDHTVTYIRNPKNVGGCENNLKGFKMAPLCSIILELNGDDWLPDNGVIDYLNRVYEDPDVWMTYNTLKLSNGKFGTGRKIPKHVIKNNLFREYPSGYGKHLQSFRQELFMHFNEDSLVDPETNEYFISGDDKALYYSLMEMSGLHSRHIERITYIKNIENIIHSNYGSIHERRLRAQKIRSMPKYKPLKTLASR